MHTYVTRQKLTLLPGGRFAYVPCDGRGSPILNPKDLAPRGEPIYGAQRYRPYIKERKRYCNCGACPEKM